LREEYLSRNGAEGEGRTSPIPLSPQWEISALGSHRIKEEGRTFRRRMDEEGKPILDGRRGAADEERWQWRWLLVDLS
jgi:hypothetical protein